jgi:hypothetical protein
LLQTIVEILAYTSRYHNSLRPSITEGRDNVSTAADLDDDSIVLSNDNGTMIAKLKRETRNALNKCNLSLTGDNDIFEIQQPIDLSYLGLRFALDTVESGIFKIGDLSIRNYMTLHFTQYRIWKKSNC